MALTPWTRQEEWYQQMINASTGNYLPSISAQDAGKVMTVESDGSWGVENVPSELPAVTASDKDKFLHTDASTGNLEWSAVNEVPAVGSSDKDKYLHTNASTGDLEWSAVSGGSGASILPAEIENDLYTETLGEVVELQITVLGQTNTYNGIEAVGMTSDIASKIYDDTTGGADPAPMKYTYRIGDVIYDDLADAQGFVPMLADDGKYYFVTDATVFDGASGEVVAIYKTALIFPPNVLCLYDPTDPKGDESYLPEYVEYDGGYWVSSDYDASGFYNALTHGNAAYAVLPQSSSNNGYEYALVGSFYPVTD